MSDYLTMLYFHIPSIADRFVPIRDIRRTYNSPRGVISPFRNTVQKDLWVPAGSHKSFWKFMVVQISSFFQLTFVMDCDIWIWVTKKNTESISIIVATEKCIYNFEKCGFAESDKWSTFIRDAVENPPSIDDLPEEYQSAYDHTGLKPVPKRKSKKGKIYAYPFVCSYCNTEYTSKYSDSAKLHMAAEFGCPVKSLMKSWKPTSYRKALFFDQNFF